MSIPNLTVTDGSNNGNVFKDVDISSGNYRLMDLFVSSTGNRIASAGDNVIGYDSSTKTWKDFGQDGSGNPKLLSNSTDFTSATDELINPEYVHIQSGSGTYMGYITNHDYASNSGGGGGSGPGTLSVVPTGWTYKVPAGVTPVEEPGRELFLNIAKSEPTDTYNIYHDGVYHATVNHTQGVLSSLQDTNTAKEYVLYRGTVYTSSSLNIIVATFTRKTKRSSNFW